MGIEGRVVLVEISGRSVSGAQAMGEEAYICSCTVHWGMRKSCRSCRYIRELGYYVSTQADRCWMGLSCSYP